MLSDISGQQGLKSFPIYTKEGGGKYVNFETNFTGFRRGRCTRLSSDGRKTRQAKDSVPIPVSPWMKESVGMG